MGRRKLDFVWEHFITSNTKGKVEYFCKYCNEKYREKNVSKKRRHILKCQLCPKNVKADVTKNYNALELTTYKTKKQKAAEAQGKKMTASPKKITILKSQPYMEGFTLNPVSTVNTELVHERLCRATVVSGCKISMIDDPLWRSVWQALEPSYFPPSKETFLNVYSENEYLKTCNDLTTMLTEAEFLHVQCEKLACYQSNIIAIWAVTDKPLFIKFIHLKNQDEAQILYEELQNILSNYLPEKFLSIIGCENSDVSMALEALKSRNDHLVSLICPLNVLEQLCDCIIHFESVVNFFQKAAAIISSIYKNDLLTAVFSQSQGNRKIMLKTPITNNYESHLSCLEDLLKCKNSLQQFAISNQLASFFKDPENKPLKKDILDEDFFWSYVEQLIAVISPLVNLLKDLKTDAQIHKIKDQWCELEKKLILTIHASFLKEEEKTEINSLFSDKKAKVLSPIHLAACLLDPNCQGGSLTDEESLDATEFIDTVARNTPGIDSQGVMEDLGNFRCKIKIWSRQFIWKSAEKMTPLSWWRGICSHSPLSKIAARILTSPAVSVSSTKSESALKWMETGRKQGLNLEKIEKFVSVSHNYKILNESNYDVKEDVGVGRDGNATVASVVVQTGDHMQSEGVEENDAVEYLEYEYIEDNS